jgi:hypothetical protein
VDIRLPIARPHGYRLVARRRRQALTQQAQRTNHGALHNRRLAAGALVVHLSPLPAPALATDAGPIKEEIPGGIILGIIKADRAATPEGRAQVGQVL